MPVQPVYKNCPDPPCDGYVPPLPDWWKSATATHCDLVVDSPIFRPCLAGTVYAQVRECNSTDPATVIDVHDPWVVDIHLEVSGEFIDCFNGFWCVSVCLESMCGPEYYRFPQDSTSPPGHCCCLVEFVPGATQYNIEIGVPAYKVRESECGSAYEPTVIVTVLCKRVIHPDLPDGDNPARYKPAGIATSCELPHMTFYYTEQDSTDP